MNILYLVYSGVSDVSLCSLTHEARPSNIFLFLIMLWAYNFTVIENVGSHQINSTSPLQQLIYAMEYLISNLTYYIQSLKSWFESI